jgi:6-phosphogluconate dehydrogenase
MRLGMIGLGKMGGRMTERLARAGHEVDVFDLDPALARSVAEMEGVTARPGIAEMVAGLTAPRVVWVMVPAGAATESTLMELADAMEPGDILIDGGNSMFRDTVRRAEHLAERGISLLDAGTSGASGGWRSGTA